MLFASLKKKLLLLDPYYKREVIESEETNYLAKRVKDKV